MSIGTKRGRGPRRSADLGRRAGGGSGPIVVNPSAHDGPKKSSTGVRSGTATLCGASATGPNLGPDLLLDTRGAAEEPQRLHFGGLKRDPWRRNRTDFAARLGKPEACTEEDRLSLRGRADAVARRENRTRPISLRQVDHSPKGNRESAHRAANWRSALGRSGELERARW
ncbi:hypothetical protein NDU88_005681 [Pleurodeles waltl]|uniref:Uncharacterized protein n=1 Tax=Pleurodeles waltl TaxID=8319 RepID=A0AAV7TC40_PLEWA|nr:hypothetical protein NDU88_005681 [Pleurodeles waltl]